MTTVNPCPFCGNEEVEIDEVDRLCFAVCCPECECIGPICKTGIHEEADQRLREAIEAWNAAGQRCAA